MIGVQAIDRLEQWMSLRDEWNQLVERCPRATPFQRPEWLLSWWRHLGNGELYVLAFRDSGRLVGLAPMFIHPWQGQRQVTLVGNGITDFLGLFAEPEFATQCANLALERLEMDRQRWDLCDWQDLPADSPLLSASPFGMEMWPVPFEHCTRAELAGHPGQAHDGLPHGLRRSLRVGQRRLERLGSVQYETVLCGGEPVRELIRLHEERWAEKGGPDSMLDSPLAQGVLLDASQQFGDCGILRLYTLRVNGALIAAILGLLDRARLYGYITGFDPEWKRFSPGSLVLDYARSEAIREGARTWEFLRGREPYKYSWGATDIRKFRLRVWHEARFAPAGEMREEEDHEPVPV